MKITVGISSGIAAFKILDLIPLLKKQGHSIQVILTNSAQKMVSIKEVEKLTGNKVFTTLFEKDFDYKEVLKERKVEHIEVAKDTDLFVIAPATANIISKLAQGLADDFLTTTILATDKPILVVPSMNTNMWNHPATQKNLKIIQQYGYVVMTPDNGWLACGVQGVGRLPEVEETCAEIEIMSKNTSRFKGKKVLVTAGGTSEPIDSARVLTNKSTGKMGVALAETFYKQGADILLVRAENAVSTNLPIEQVSFVTFQDLYDILERRSLEFDIIVHAAAVSDYTVDQKRGKIDSSENLSLELLSTPKILNEIKKWNPRVQLIGFKAVHGIAEDIFGSLDEKFETSQADFFIVNDISRKDIGFGTDENEVYVVSKDKKVTKIDKNSKKEVVKNIIDLIHMSS
ncbi:MAG TPA: bifunctional phosphopantothenoylcysteine decarboxylase/phosphopantothenate--cysteine ligase CoaBC [Candidatus Woesebacteria bacterium]|nr:bifunctional phosphopantothenoylcysteine decarboxylase/phosphopantothenate--cysteine ligase CoaBC [Candidatus Woesebacteria bacterium]